MNDSPRPLRLTMVYGSVRPRFCGVEAATAIMHTAFPGQGVDVAVVSADDWGVGGARDLARNVAAAAPDAIMLAYPTLAIDRKLGPVLFSLLQRIAPLVVVLHEFNHVHVLRRLAISALCLRATRIVVTTEAEKEGLLRWNPWLRRRLRVNPIPTNIPAREWRPAPRLEITMLSQLRPEKGLECFLDCCAALRTARPELAFRIIGSEVPRYAAFAADIRRVAAERGVELSEDLADDQVAEALRGASVALLPFPDGATERRSSLIAAAMCGVPIVTTAGPDTPPDLVAALSPVPLWTVPLSATRDGATLVRRTLELCDDPARRTEAHRASLRYAAKFDTAVIAEALAGHLRAAALQPGGAPVPA